MCSSKIYTNLLKAKVLVKVKVQRILLTASALILSSSKRVKWWKNLIELQGHYLSGEGELRSKGNEEILMFNPACTLTPVNKQGKNVKQSRLHSHQTFGPPVISFT